MIKLLPANAGKSRRFELSEEDTSTGKREYKFIFSGALTVSAKDGDQPPKGHGALNRILHV